MIKPRVIDTFLFFGILIIGNTAYAQSSTANLPQIYLDTTYQSSISGTCSVTLQSGSDIQATLDTLSQTSHSVICLQAGGTFDPFILRNKIGGGWITIRSSTPDSQFVTPGNRVKPSDSSSMAQVRSQSPQDVIYAESGAHNYRLIGLEITSTFATRSNIHYHLVKLGNEESVLSMTPTDIIIDRSYIHGTPTGNYRRGVVLNGRRQAVIDSYISDIHEVGADSQAIGGWNGAGPFKIVNNYLEAAGENVMFGGSDTKVSGLIPSDIEIRNNYFFKPLSWKIGHASYAGIPWSVKNIFELKNAQRVIVDSNIFENNWTHAQSGTAILFNGVDGPTSAIRHVTFTNNIVKNADGAFALCSNCIQPQLEGINNIIIKNNLFENVGGRGLQLNNGPTEVTFDNNMILGSYLYFNAEEVFPTNLIFRNNIVKHNEYGVSGGALTLGGSSASSFFTSIVFQKNVIMDHTAAFPNFYPAQNYVVSSSDVGFVNYNNGNGGNYSLSASSPYKNNGTDGKDIGVDMNALLAATATVISGNNGGSILPPSDTTPPVFSNISAGTITTDSVMVTWTTNESSDTQVEYGLTASYGSSSTLNATLGSSHSVPLTGLTPNTLYHYRVKSRDGAGNQAISVDQTFTTRAVVATVVDPTLNVITKDFGSLPVGSSTQPFMFSINNPNSSFVGVSAVAVTGDFSITTNYCTSGMQPSTHCDIYVAFNPSTSGTRTGALTITLTGASTNTLSVTLTGTGTAVNTPEDPPILPPPPVITPPPVVTPPIIPPPQKIPPPGIIITKTLARGMTSPEIIILQTHLKQIGLFENSIQTSNYFGPATERAVKLYQASKGIEQTGIVGPLTRGSLAGSSTPPQTVTSQVLPTTVYIGVKHSDVVKLQNILKRLGFFPQNVDSSGYFGPTTKKAVQAFQRQYTIASSGTENTTGYGMVGKKTWAKLLGL